MNTSSSGSNGAAPAAAPGGSKANGGSGSHHASTHNLPRDSRLVALMLSQYCEQADPGVLAQLTEFAHRYTGEVLSDALVYSDHGHRGAHPSMNAQSNAGQGTNSLSMADVRLAIQAKTEQGINTPWPKDYMQNLANQLNSQPLPPLHEYYGIRLPPPAERLTQLNYDLKNKGRPAPAVIPPQHQSAAAGDASAADPFGDFSHFSGADVSGTGHPAAAAGGGDHAAAASGMELDASAFGQDLFGDFGAAQGYPASGLDQPFDLPMSLPPQQQQQQQQSQQQQPMDQDAPGEEEDAPGEEDDAA